MALEHVFSSYNSNKLIWMVLFPRQHRWAGSRSERNTLHLLSLLPLPSFQTTESM